MEELGWLATPNLDLFPLLTFFFFSLHRIFSSKCTPFPLFEITFFKPSFIERTAPGGMIDHYGR